MFFGLARQPDPLAETRAFLRRAEEARRRGRAAEDDRRAVAAAFAAPPRPVPRFDLTRRDTARRMAERFPAPPVRRTAERLPGARQRAEIRVYRPTLSERVGDLIHNGARAIGVDRVTAHRMRDEAVHVPVVGDALTGLDGLTDIGRGDFLSGAGQVGLAAIGAAPGAGDAAAYGLREGGRRMARRGGSGGGGGLPMDEASRLARAEAMGYRNEPFHRGEARPGPLPDEGRPGFFSRSQTRADGYAHQGGHAAAREFRLSFSRPLRYRGQYTLRDFADVLQALRRSGDVEGMRRLAGAAPTEQTYSAAQLVRFAQQQPDRPLGPGGQLYHLLERNFGESAEGILRNAGFDAVDTGLDVRMLTGEGIRLRSAAFDPRRMDSRNIHMGLAPAGLGLGLYGLPGEASPPER